MKLKKHKKEIRAFFESHEWEPEDSKNPDFDYECPECGIAMNLHNIHYPTCLVAKVLGRDTVEG